jgi:multiple sugar transport system permease protein
MSRSKLSQHLSHLCLHIGLLAVGTLFVLPFVWGFATSLKPMSDLFQLVPSFIPSEYRWQNYADVVNSVPFFRFYLNSTIVTVGRVIPQIFICSLAAFAFARLRFPGRDALFIVLLASLMVPAQITIIPNFVIVRQFGWLDTYWGIIVPTLFSVFGTFLLRQFFMSIPNELQEAAIIEGANPLQIYWHIFLPLARPALAAFALIQILWSWNDFLWPLIVTSSTEMQVLPVGIALFQGQFTTNTAILMAAAMLATVPMIIVFLLAQRQLIEGIAMSGIK